MPELFLFLSNKLTVLFKNSRDGVEINQKSILVVESLFIISYIYEYELIETVDGFSFDNRTFVFF